MASFSAHIEQGDQHGALAVWQEVTERMQDFGCSAGAWIALNSLQAPMMEALLHLTNLPDIAPFEPDPRAPTPPAWGLRAAPLEGSCISESVDTAFPSLSLSSLFAGGTPPSQSTARLSQVSSPVLATPPRAGQPLLARESSRAHLTPRPSTPRSMPPAPPLALVPTPLVGGPQLHSTEGHLVALPLDGVVFARHLGQWIRGVVTRELGFKKRGSVMLAAPQVSWDGGTPPPGQTPTKVWTPPKAGPCTDPNFLCARCQPPS